MLQTDTATLCAMQRIEQKHRGSNTVICTWRWVHRRRASICRSGTLQDKLSGVQAVKYVQRYDGSDQQ